jgi:hypothetical protein
MNQADYISLGNDLESSSCAKIWNFIARMEDIDSQNGNGYPKPANTTVDKIPNLCVAAAVLAWSNSIAPFAGSNMLRVE